MNDFYPLPLSSNFRLFQYTIQAGDLNQCKVVWPGSFLKKHEKLEAKHVFILQRQNAEHVFVSGPTTSATLPSSHRTTTTYLTKPWQRKKQPLPVQGARRVRTTTILPSILAQLLVQLGVQLPRRWLHPWLLPKALQVLQRKFKKKKAKHEVQRMETLRQNNTVLNSYKKSLLSTLIHRPTRQI